MPPSIHAWRYEGRLAGITSDVVCPLDNAELWRHGVRRDAILSHDFFRDQRVTIDWERRELVVDGKD